LQATVGDPDILSNRRKDDDDTLKREGLEAAIFSTYTAIDVGTNKLTLRKAAPVTVETRAIALVVDSGASGGTLSSPEEMVLESAVPRVSGTLSESPVDR